MSLTHVLDYSHGRAFSNAGVAAVCVGFGGKRADVVEVQSPGRAEESPTFVARDLLLDRADWGFLLSQHIDVLTTLSRSGSTVGDFVVASDPFTVSEAYRLRDYIEEHPAVEESFRFINTGTVDPFVSRWGISDVRYLKKRFAKPVVAKAILKKEFPRRYAQSAAGKLVLSGMRKFEAFWDEEGAYVAGKSSVIAVPRNSSEMLPTLLGILNSRLMRFFVQESFGVLGVDGGISFSGAMVEQLPLPVSEGGRIGEVEAAVFLILRVADNEDLFEQAIQELDDAVFRAYSVPPDVRRRILETEVRC